MSSEKKNVAEAETKASRLNIISLRCGDCGHHKGTAHPSFGQPCAKLGIKAYATAPSCYAPDVTVFRKTGPEVFVQLASILSTLSPQQSRVLMGLLKSAGSLEKFGFQFLQKVYFRAGDDYLDNYFRGVVLGTGFEGTLAVVGVNFFTSSRASVIAYLFPDSVLSSDQFYRRRKKLFNSGALYAPRKPHRNDIVTVEYEPPTFESSAEALEAAAKAIKKVKRPPGKVGNLEVKFRKDDKKTVDAVEEDEMSED